MKRGDHGGEVEAHIRGAGGHGGGDGQRAREVAVLGPVVLGDDDADGAQPIGPLGHLDTRLVPVRHGNPGEGRIPEVEAQREHRCHLPLVGTFSGRTVGSWTSSVFGTPPRLSPGIPVRRVPGAAWSTKSPSWGNVLLGILRDPSLEPVRDFSHMTIPRGSSPYNSLAEADARTSWRRAPVRRISRMIRLWLTPTLGTVVARRTRLRRTRRPRRPALRRPRRPRRTRSWSPFGSGRGTIRSLRFSRRWDRLSSLLDRATQW